MFSLNHLKDCGPLMTAPDGGSWIRLAGDQSRINITLPFPVLVNVIGAELPQELAKKVRNGLRDHIVMEPQPVGQKPSTDLRIVPPGSNGKP